MDILINLRPEELTEDFYKQLQHMASVASTIEIKINKVNHLSDAEIATRLQQLEERKVVSFTIEEFNDYVHQIAS